MSEEAKPTSEPENFFLVGPTKTTVRTHDGTILTPPEDWVFLAAGDATLTRRVRAAGDHWIVKFRKGRKFYSKGTWAPQPTIDRIKEQLVSERSAPEFAKRVETNARRREKKQTNYVDEFFDAIIEFLAFDPKYSELAEQMARAITDHATPIGSGTVARTQRIPIAERAEAAVLAWMRHHTTDYENMTIPRVRDGRRKVRRKLVKQSLRVLQHYRQGQAPPEAPIERALKSLSTRTVAASTTSI